MTALPVQRRFHNLAGIAPVGHRFYRKLQTKCAAGLGDTTPAQMAPMIVATRSAMELYSTNGIPKNWAVSALIAKWGMDQLINNGVSVSLGKDTIQFIKQPNGTFTPPAGSTMTLLRTNNTYWLVMPRQHFKFNARGQTNIHRPIPQNPVPTTQVIGCSVKIEKSPVHFNLQRHPLRLTSSRTTRCLRMFSRLTGSGNQFAWQ
jgi:hypothetical protein